MKHFQFCPLCGTKLLDRLVHNRQRLIRPQCGWIFTTNELSNNYWRYLRKDIRAD